MIKTVRTLDGMLQIMEENQHHLTIVTRKDLIFVDSEEIVEEINRLQHKATAGGSAHRWADKREERISEMKRKAEERQELIQAMVEASKERHDDLINTLRESVRKNTEDTKRRIEEVMGTANIPTPYTRSPEDVEIDIEEASVSGNIHDEPELISGEEDEDDQ